jgi:hypothetical protein
VPTLTPPLTDRSPFMTWAGKTADNIDARARLSRLEDVASIALDEPEAPDAGTTTISAAPDPDLRYPDPASALRSTAAMLAGVTIAAVILAAAARLLRRRHP